MCIFKRDSYDLRCLIYKLFNGNFKLSSELIKLNNIPTDLINDYFKLINSNPN